MKKRQFQLKDYAIAVGVFILAVIVGIFLFLSVFSTQYRKIPRIP